MHTRTPFRVSDADRVSEALRRYGFATLISADKRGRPYASRLATILRRDGDGRVRLWTHIDRRNPQLETLAEDRELLLVANGPDAYLSPAWYLRHPSVPSWNYIAVHVRGKPRFFADEQPQLIDWLLRETVAEYESRREAAWTYDAPGKFHHRLARGFVGFEIEISELAAAFKLRHDKPEPNKRSVIGALGSAPDSGQREIARLMELELGGGAFNDFGEIPPATIPTERTPG